MEICKSIGRIYTLEHCRIPLIFAVVMLSGCDFTEKQVAQPVEITCLAETRGGETSCWGIIIQLARGRFNPTISANEIRVVDSKYNRDLSPLMEWTVSLDGKQLTIRFKQGFGDFGSGNAVNIWVAKIAFREPPPGLPDSAHWSIETDIKGK